MTRRAFALLAVLAAVVIIMAALAGVIAALGSARRQAACTDDADHLLDALEAGERLACGWVAGDAAAVVLPPAGGSVPLVHDRWITEDGEGDLTVVMYDGCGGVPVTGDALRSPLRLALPPDWQGLAASEALSPIEVLERLVVPPGRRRFPSLSAGPAMTWTGPGVSPVAVTAGGDDPGLPGAPSLAEVIAPFADNRININTAPVELLRVAFTELGLGGVDAVIDRRERGERSVAPTVRPASEPKSLDLIDASPVWHALIAVRWGEARRSWWVVIGTGNRGSPVILQRHDADR